jgi:hypothetical protein
MLALLLIALLFVVLFGGLGLAVSPLFFILLLVVLLLAIGGGFHGRGGHW